MGINSVVDFNPLEAFTLKYQKSGNDEKPFKSFSSSGMVKVTRNCVILNQHHIFAHSANFLEPSNAHLSSLLCVAL